MSEEMVRCEHNETAIIVISAVSLPMARIIKDEITDAVIYTKEETKDAVVVSSLHALIEENFSRWKQVIFFGASGICVRMIAPYLKDKHEDPAVVCVDSKGLYAIPIVSGHIGGANQLAKDVAHMLGAEAVVTTQSDTEGLWALDTLGKRFGWKADESGLDMNQFIAEFVRRRPTALVLEMKNKGTHYLEKSLPDFVTCFYDMEDVPVSAFKLMIVVTPYEYPETAIPALIFHPKAFSLGVGCRKQSNPEEVADYITKVMLDNKLCKDSIERICTIELKKDEPLVKNLAESFGADIRIYSADELKDIEVPNPSEKAFEVTGVYGVAESCALKSSRNDCLLLPKQKGCIVDGSNFTFAVAMNRGVQREGFIEIVGAGPGDPELISVRGKELLQEADLILYAGSLVPIELTYYAKPEAVIRSSAGLDLEEQVELMKTYYDKGLLVVRLHTGDPCLFGAIEEQMAYFDKYGIQYRITPGISAFQAAAAELKSQFTIPEKVQTIILTRGKGRTPMPEKEALHKLAQSQSTMCIYLSANVVEDVQKELLMAYPPTTPVAVCYKLTWKDERIYRGQLKDLSLMVRENNLKLTTLLVVGDAIDNREGLSRLYAREFKHLFRK